MSTVQPSSSEEATEDGQRRPSIPSWMGPGWLGSRSALLWAMFLMEGTWFYLWMMWLSNWTALGVEEAPFHLATVLLILLASYYTVQVLGQQRWSDRKSHVVAGMFTVAVLVLVARLENGGGYEFFDLGWLDFARGRLAGGIPTGLQASLFGGAYLWWRGYRIAHEGLDREHVVYSFRVGLVAMTLGLLVWESAIRAELEFTATRGDALVITTLFSVSALSALVLSHLVGVRTELARQEGVPQAFSEQWTMITVGVVGGMIAAGWLIVGFLFIDFWPPVLKILSLIYLGVGYVLYVLLLPIAFLTAGLVFVAQWVVSRFGSDTPTTFRLPDLGALRSIPEDNGALAQTPIWVVVAKWSLILLIIGVVIYVLARLVLRSRYTTEQPEAVKETHESVGSWDDFIRDVLMGLFTFLSRIRHRGLRLVSRVQIAPRVRYESPEHEMGVRELYSRLLQEARDAGFPRKESETPFDYLPTLARQVPSDEGALERITQDYVVERYGEQPVTQQEVGVLNRLWRDILSRIQEIRQRGNEEEDTS